MSAALPFRYSRLRDPENRVISVSVDCDGVGDYGNFSSRMADEAASADALTYKVLIPRLLDLFHRHGIRATFFCIGGRLAADRDAAKLMRQALALGHAIGNHSFSHPDMSLCDGNRQRGEVLDGHRAIADALNVAAVGYRGPAYHVSDATLDALSDLNYVYDSSACPARLFPLALSVLQLLNPQYRRKQPAPMQLRFKSDAPGIIERDSSKPLLEWPIPVALGLPFYGTFHAVAPRHVFYAHLSAATRRKHLHYELHPIEVVDGDAAKSHPWLPTSRTVLKRGRDLTSWLDERLGRLIVDREVLTLEELSASHLPLR